MNDTKYNGWTNYATWRVNLELIDGMTPDDFGLTRSQQTDAYELSLCLKDTVHDIIENTSTEGISRDYALAFISDVNWREIAQHMIADYADETETEKEN
tara:strand:- start:1462 stop:1758 length:297 start_codon:yes stop_codon:yes gene_type:complete